MLAHVVVRIAATVVGVCIFWFEGNGLAKVLDGAVIFALVVMSNATIEVCVCNFRIEGNGFVIIPDGAVVFALFVVSIATTDVGICDVFLRVRSRINDGCAAKNSHVRI